MISADLSNMGDYMAVVGGIVRAMEDPRFEGNFTEHLTTRVKKHFMTETIAVHMSGAENLSHVFEWGAQTASGVSTGRPSNIPLFRLTRSSLRSGQMLSYEFLPSVKPVPLPNPKRYGFPASKISNMTRHTFQMKALVMETQSNVRVSPVMAKKLFIPSETAKRGYVMSSGPVSLNPGGQASTGAFAKWWTSWFEARAADIVNAEAKLTEQMLGETGRKLVRYAAGTVINGEKVGGRFVQQSGVSISYVNAEQERVKEEVISRSARFFDEEKWESTWD